MDDSLVTVVIPTRNRLMYLQEAVESVRRQTYSRWQLVVVDDASEDGTWPWLRDLADPRIRALRLPRHAERSAARNLGMTEAQGEHLLFLDDDDRLTPWALETLVGAITGHPDAVFAVGARLLFDERGNRMCMPHPRMRFVRHGPWRDVLLEWVSLPGQTLFRAAALRDVGGWDERLTIVEDQELLLRVGIRGACVLTPRVVLENRTHAGQWRPRDTATTEEEFRREFVRGLSGDSRELGERLLIVRALLKEAYGAYEARCFLQTARLVAKGARTLPEVLWSPLVGSRLLGLWLRSVAGIAVGGYVFAAATALRRAVRRTTGSQVVTNPRVVDRTARFERQ